MRDLTAAAADPTAASPLATHDEIEDLCMKLDRAQLCDVCAALERAGGEEAGVRAALDEGAGTMRAAMGEVRLPLAALCALLHALELAAALRVHAFLYYFFVL